MTRALLVVICLVSPWMEMSCSSTPTAESASGCPDGMKRFSVGCDNDDPAFRGGCHRPCRSDDDCDDGDECRSVSVSPRCEREPFGGHRCMMCGKQQQLCLPPLADRPKPATSSLSAR
ncbi:MAG TPA: hypothetical protein ENK57_00955 [Polyangiaceae bacterium]|nr:hypothetical protein [Polyangiaceae bacterium]